MWQIHPLENRKEFDFLNIFIIFRQIFRPLTLAHNMYLRSGILDPNLTVKQSTLGIKFVILLWMWKLKTAIFSWGGSRLFEKYLSHILSDITSTVIKDSTRVLFPVGDLHSSAQANHHKLRWWSKYYLSVRGWAAASSDMIISAVASLCWTMSYCHQLCLSVTPWMLYKLGCLDIWYILSVQI